MSTSPVDPGGLLAYVLWRFTADERAALDTVADEGVADERFRLLPTLAAWGWHVGVLEAQLDEGFRDPDPTVWGPDDLVGALFVRDALEELVHRAPDALRSTVRDVVDVFDAVYRDITVDDVGGEITVAARVRRFRAGWWWHRVPDRGPVRQGLDAFATDPWTHLSAMRRRFPRDEWERLQRIGDGDAPHDGLTPLMAEWATGVRVVGLQGAQSRPIPATRPWTVADLAGVLAARDRVEALLVRLPTDLALRVKEVLGAIDEEYRAGTVDDDRGRLVGARAPGPDGAGWWWGRVPAQGPVRTELDRGPVGAAAAETWRGCRSRAEADARAAVRAARRRPS